MLAASAVLWVFVVLALAADWVLPTRINDRSLLHLADATAVVAGAVAALLGFVRWRLTGETRPLWVGAAALLLGPVAALGGTLLPSVVGVTDGVPEVRIGARLVALAALFGGVLWHEIDTRIRPVMLFVSTSTAAALLALAMAASPWGHVVADVPWVRLAMALGWASAAWFGHRQFRRSGDVGMLAVATAAAVLAFSESVWATVTDEASLYATTGATALQAAALIVLLVRGIRDLEVAFVLQRQRLLDREIKAEIEDAKRRARQTLDDARAHDARNSLMAIESAAVLLDRRADQLDPERAKGIRAALGSEVGRLRGLVQTDESPAGHFDVHDMARRVVHRTAGGVEVDFQVPEDLHVFGHPGEASVVLDQLIHNASEHAPGLPVTVRAARDGQWVSLYVDDRGAGVDPSDRTAIFEDDGRAPAKPGEGLRLFAARQLMVEQGGDMWVEPRPGGGASFGVCWPLSVADAGEAPVEVGP